MDNILNVVFVYLLYIAIFSIIYAFTWGIIRNYFSRFTIYYQVIIGGVFGILSILAQGLIPSFVKDIDVRIVDIYLPLILCWIIGVFVSWFSTILYTAIIFIFTFGISPFLKEYFLPLEKTMDIITIAILYFLVLAVTFISWFYKWSQWTTWSLLSLISFVILSIITLTQINKATVTEGLVNELHVLIWIGMSYLAYAISAIIELIYNHALKLQNIIEYDRTTYIREALAHEAIYEMIQREKIRKGVYMTFSINNINKLDKIASGVIKNKIIDIISHQVFHLWKDENVLFFKASLNHFGIFMPIEQVEKFKLSETLEHNKVHLRPEMDILKRFEILLKQVKDTFILKEYKIIVKVQGYASFYGIQSNNLDKLKEYNLTMANNRSNIEYANQVICTDLELIKEIDSQNRRVLALNQEVELAKILSLYSSIVNVKNNFLIESHYATNLVNGNNIDSLYNNDVKKWLKTADQVMLSRYIAALNIKNFKKFYNNFNHKLFISYSTSFFGSEEFNFKKFATKLIELKIKPNNLVLVFDLKETDYDVNLFEKNIQQIHSLGINVAAKNITGVDSDLTSLAYLKPKYCIIEANIIKEMFIYLHNQELLSALVTLCHKLQIKLIAPHVNSYITYNKLRKLKINYMFGSLFGTNETPQTDLTDEIKFMLKKNELKGV